MLLAPEVEGLGHQPMCHWKGNVKGNNICQGQHHARSRSKVIRPQNLTFFIPY